MSLIIESLLIGAVSPGFLVYAGVALLLGIISSVGWVALGRGPRRRRNYRRILKLIDEKRWSDALDEVRRLQGFGLLSRVWQSRIRQAEGECHRLAGETALSEKRFTEALESLLKSARLLDKDEAPCRTRVIDEMLEEVRRLFVAISPNPFQVKSSKKNSSPSNGQKNGALPDLIRQLLGFQSPCPEASFWLGLWQAQQNRIDLALASLEDSYASAGGTVFDPPFYLGVLRLREGRISEALRHLSDTNRMAPECPLVPWQLGMAMVSEGGKDSLAVRPLQKALGPNGLAAWLRSPYKLWQEALPDREHSYVRRLAEKYPFVCPVLGADVGAMIRQGQVALAQAQCRLGNFAEAVDLYESVLKESPPTLPILRGLGTSLARLERYDEAFKHLRAAFELEQNQDRQGGSALTVGYLALCGAKGRPSQPEDKQKNVLWAIRSMSGFNLPGDIEWARVNSTVFAEARSLNLSVPLEDQIRLCNLLASVDATDAEAAAAYHQLALTSPQSLRPEHAWLYCRAVEQHTIENPKDLGICHRAFADELGMRAFFEKRGWYLEEVEYLILARCAASGGAEAISRLPDSLRSKSESFLLARSQRQEQAGQTDKALASAEVLVRLAPHCAQAYDLLARLNYQAGHLRRASETLAKWHEQFPDDFRPLVRKAVIDQKRGQTDDSLLAIRKALERSRGSTRTEIAVLGGRLALLSNRAQQALSLFEQALQDDLHHPTAWWCAAAVRCRLGRRDLLASQLPSSQLSETSDPRFHYMVAATYLAAGKYAQSYEAARKAGEAFPASGSIEAAECKFLMGLAHLWQQDIPAASVAFQEVMNCPDKAPSADHARAQLARIRFSRGTSEEAIDLWKGLPKSKRKEWGLDEPLQQTIFLAAVQALKSRRYERAAEFLRESCLNTKDAACSALLTYSLVKAGQEAVQRSEYETARRFLQEAILNGCQDSTVAYELAQAYRHLGRVPRAREALQKIVRPDGDTFFQLGLLSLEEKRLAQAEEEFARAWAENPEHYPAGYNLLFTRLSLGQIDRALELLPKVLERSNSNDRASLELLNGVLRNCQASDDDNMPPLMLGDSSAGEEQRLLEITRELGHPTTATKILHTIASQRPGRTEFQTAFLEAILVQAKQLLDRCDWHEAGRILAPWIAKEGSTPQSIRVALLNLYGCCNCLSQDFETAMHSFTTALQIQNRDARLSQNLALTYELQGRLADAESQWNWYLETLDGRTPTPPNPPGYRDRLAFECLHRLALRFSEKGKWTNALTFFQRAHQLRPEDADTVERLFHLLNQLKKPEEARKMLRRLQQLRPQEPQIEMFELELIELNNLENCNRALAGIESLKQKYPDDGRLPEREGQLVGAVVTYLKRLSRQISEQLDRAAARVRRLPSQRDWPEMRHYLRDLRGRMQRLKKTAGRCLALAASEQYRRDLQQLISHADQEIDHCRTLV